MQLCAQPHSTLPSIRSGQVRDTEMKMQWERSGGWWRRRGGGRPQLAAWSILRKRQTALCGRGIDGICDKWLINWGNRICTYRELENTHEVYSFVFEKKIAVLKWTYLSIFGNFTSQFKIVYNFCPFVASSLFDISFFE